MQEVVGLSKEAYRHWRKVLPQVAAKGGRAPRFTIGDLVALSVIYRLTEIGGVRIGNMKVFAGDIFELCNNTSWPALKGTSLHVDLAGRTCDLQFADSPTCDLALVCRLDPVLEVLGDTLLSMQPESQQTQLRFPPASIGTIKNSTRQA